MKKLFLSAALLLLSSLPSQASDQGPPPPAVLTHEAYVAWLESIGSVINPFHEYLFSWLEQNWTAPLPNEVYQDPENLFVSVDRPLQETIELEGAGDLEEGITYGLETYTIIPAPIEVALEAFLFKWGKPIGKTEGTTHPMDTVYGYRSESLSERWGYGNFQTITEKSDGGVAKPQRDIFTLLLRGNAHDGYVLVGNFLKPNGKTSTTSSMGVMIFQPLPDGRTVYKVTSRHLGQSYKFFGIDYGRRNFGFNRDRIRTGQKEFISSVIELLRTGTIKERDSALFRYPGSR